MPARTHGNFTCICQGFAKAPTFLKSFWQQVLLQGGFEIPEGDPRNLEKTLDKKSWEKQITNMSARTHGTLACICQGFVKAPTFLKTFRKQVVLQGGPPNSQGWPTKFGKSSGQEIMEKKNHQHACKTPWQFGLHLPRFRQGANNFEKVFGSRFCCRGVSKIPKVTH